MCVSRNLLTLSILDFLAACKTLTLDVLETATPFTGMMPENKLDLMVVIQFTKSSLC